jgi:DNA-binding beta-propeller fold protein YncE
VLVVAAVFAAVVAIDVVVFVLARGGTDAAAAGPGHADAVAVIDPARGRVVSTLSVGRLPTVVAAGYGGAWVLNRGAGTVTHIDARTRRVVGTVAPDHATATDLALGDGGVWFVGRALGPRPLQSAALERINPATGAVDRTFDTQTGATAFAAGGGALWSTGYLGGHVRGAARSDESTGSMSPLDIGIYGDLVTADGTAAYYVASIANRIARVSTRTGLLTQSLKLVSDASLAAGNVPASPTDVVAGGGAVWISKSDGELLKVDPRLGGIVAEIPACSGALALAYGEGAVWVACGDHTVVRVDPLSDRPSAPIHVGGLPRGIAAGEHAVWVTIN